MTMKTWRLSGLLGVMASVIAVVTVDHWVIESILVPSQSMVPTLLANERAFLCKWGCEQIARFDVVVIRSRAMGHRIVKRVIGLPGECVRVSADYRVSLNDQPLSYNSEGEFDWEQNHHRIRTQGPSQKTKNNYENVCLDKDQYFVLGDNRIASRDGRFFGPVSRAEIQGKVVLVWYSFDRALKRLRWERISKRVF